MMNEYVKIIEARLDSDQADMLKSIYAPKVVATPLADARRDICILKDGEIRSYGESDGGQWRDESKPYAYLSSIDGGISWTKHYAKGKMNSCTYVPEWDLYVRFDGRSDGFYCMTSKLGPDDPSPTEKKVADGAFFDHFLPVKSRFSDRIWCTAQKTNSEGLHEPHYFFSDDRGESWQVRVIKHPAPCPIVYPHKGPRWRISCGTEPYAIELNDGRMVMILRNSNDFFYQSFSGDGGNSWSDPEPSVFHGTDTTAFMLNLSDGRILTLWNNTQPLPELNHDTQIPPLDSDSKKGVWEDVFTNRDAAHAAICDGNWENWTGFREIHLNQIRNNADFRYAGDFIPCSDKSVHQFQAFELPYNKVLVCMGQSSYCRKLVIFDLDWLYETDRSESFLGGLGNVSTHVYLKSLSGSTLRFGNGHCAWNRISGATMMPDPDGVPIDRAYICKHRDDRRFSDVEGIVWNFPASGKGRVSVEIKIMEKSINFTLSDRWFNPCDVHAGELSAFTFDLDTADIGKDFAKVEIEYDTEKGEAEVFSDGRSVFTVKMKNPAPCGISYLIIQCMTDGESDGAYVKKLEKTL